ncbi:SNF2 family DNA-dependent ATPase [Mycena kentingensis (nom. inval.)]|nr:SNF2 family DNA-dependent ATPase [Mycena kentingensis (nom. inval.)]
MSTNSSDSIVSSEALSLFLPSPPSVETSSSPSDVSDPSNVSGPSTASGPSNASWPIPRADNTMDVDEELSATALPLASTSSFPTSKSLKRYPNLERLPKSKHRKVEVIDITTEEEEPELQTVSKKWEHPTKVQQALRKQAFVSVPSSSSSNKGDSNSAPTAPTAPMAALKADEAKPDAKAASKGCYIPVTIPSLSGAAGGAADSDVTGTADPDATGVDPDATGVDPDATALSSSSPAAPSNSFSLNYDDGPIRGIDLGGDNQEQKLAEFITKGIENLSHGVTVKEAFVGRLRIWVLRVKEIFCPASKYACYQTKRLACLGCSSGSGRDRGGILADDMGLGKTVQMIATMVMNQPDEDETDRTTLVVVPAALMQQWKEELLSKTNISEMFTIHIASRQRQAQETLGSSPIQCALSCSPPAQSLAHL